MIHNDRELIYCDIPKSKICDMCKKEFDINDPECDQFIKIYKCGPSNLFYTSSDLSIDLCQYCLKHIVDHFNININEEL